MEEKVCPYYIVREDLNRAEVMFLPYNYLVDPMTRKSQKIDLENAIVIFDEGHNLVIIHPNV